MLKTHNSQGVRMKLTTLFNRFSIVLLVSLSQAHAEPEQQTEQKQVEQEFTAIDTKQELETFVQQAKELGFTDQEIAAVLEQVTTRGLTSEDITEFFNTVLKQKEATDGASDATSVEAPKPSVLYYAAIIGGGVLAAWLLYQLYEMMRIRNMHEVKVKADPADGLSEEEIQKAEEQISAALRGNGNAKKVVFDLAGENPGVRVKAHWMHRGANYNISVKV